jgi:hypothetical protein
MKAYELLEKSEWIQGYYAKTNHNVLCDADDEKAVKFSLDGALRKCYPNYNYHINSSILYTFIHTSLCTWNDTPGRTKQEVIDLLKKADL